MVTMQNKPSHLLNCAVFDPLTADELSVRKCVVTTVRINGSTFLSSSPYSPALDGDCLTSVSMA